MESPSAAMVSFPRRNAAAIFAPSASRVALSCASGMRSSPSQPCVPGLGHRPQIRRCAAAAHSAGLQAAAAPVAIASHNTMRIILLSVGATQQWELLMVPLRIMHRHCQ